MAICKRALRSWHFKCCRTYNVAVFNSFVLILSEYLALQQFSVAQVLLLYI